MNRSIYFILLISILSFALGSCNRNERKEESLQKFDSESWRNDKNGCSGKRLLLRSELLSIKHHMRGMKNDEIESFLGKPDAQELYNRSQRYYIYFLDPGPKCEKAVEDPQALFVRFSAVGIANEFVIKPL